MWDLTDAYKSLNEALLPRRHPHPHQVNIHYIDSEQIERGTARSLAGMDAILVPGGFGSAASKARSPRSATLAKAAGSVPGICFGMQVAVIEFARTSPD